jgi:hypothetical protein
MKVIEYDVHSSKLQAVFQQTIRQYIDMQTTNKRMKHRIVPRLASCFINFVIHVSSIVNEGLLF